MLKNTDGEVIVSRPPVVWDTRAPFGIFLPLHRRVNQTYYTLYLAAEKLAQDTAVHDESKRARDILEIAHPNGAAARALGRLRESMPSDVRGEHPAPRVADLVRFLASGRAALTQHAIVSYCGIFEQFLQCWSLNYILARLEDGAALNDDERRLVHRFSPERTSDVLPNFRYLVNALPVIERELTSTPHVFRDFRTGGAVEKPISGNLNAYTVVGFWRDWRNLLVHGPGIITQRFFDTYETLWIEFRLMYPRIPDLRVGEELYLDQDTFRPFATVHYRAARHLRDVLIKASAGRRGHSLAPAAPMDRIPPELLPSVPPPLLLPGDHIPSVNAAGQRS